MYEDDNISGNEEILSSNCEEDPIDESIEEPVELLMISTCEVWESILVTKKVTLQEDNEKQYLYCFKMDPLVQVVTLELNNTQPANITIDPIPYLPYDPFQEKKKLLIYVYYLDKLLQGALSPAERLPATRSILDYYKRVSIRGNNLLIIGKCYLEEISSSRNSFNIPS
ncbi:19213_t:CDS:2, partial [Gigaspora margarita]